MPTPQETRIEDLLIEVRSVIRTLRGENGYIGLVAQVAQLEERIERLTEDVQKLSGLMTIDEFGCKFGRATHLQEEDRISKNSVTWKWIRDNLSVPLITAVMITIVNAIILSRLLPPTP